MDTIMKTNTADLIATKYEKEISKMNFSESDSKKLKKSCQDFEALMISYILKEAQSGMNKDGILSGGKGEEIFADLKNSAIAEKMSEVSNFGIGELLYKSFEIKDNKNIKKVDLTPIVKEGGEK